MSLNIYTFSNLIEKGDAYKKIRHSMANKRLVPVIGSGFSSSMPACRGRVPNVKDLKKSIVHFLIEHFPDYQNIPTDQLSQLDLSALADVFIDSLPITDGHIVEAPKYFLDYMENYYTGVHGLSSEQSSFLKCSWPYLYTLNYDTAIESVLKNYVIITPYQKLNLDWLKEKPCLIKLHGDVNTLLKTNDMRNCILSKKQYLNSITNKENRHLMNWLQDDYSSKDLLFIGCGLSNEYDFLFAEGGNSIDRLSGDSINNSFFIYYDENPDTDIPFEFILRAKSYGIGNIIRVTPTEYLQFYELIASMYEDVQKVQATDKFDRYHNLKFVTNKSKKFEDNIPFFFSNSPLTLNSSHQEIHLPVFFIQRNISSEIEKELQSGTTLCILTGNRFSGKTYALLGILNTLQEQRKSVYFFSDVKLSDSAIDSIYTHDNSVFIFDCDVITNQQYRHKIENQLNILREKKIQIIYTVNNSDRNFIKNFQKSILSQKESIKVFFIENCLNQSELSKFNAHMGELSLIDREAKETFLDYVIRIEDTLLSNEHNTNKLPDTNIITTKNPNLLLCVLLLVNSRTISNEIASFFDIREELSYLCESAEIAVQKDYLSKLEITNSTHSGVKFVSNSVYWLYRCLSNFAKNTSHYEMIAESICSIVNKYFEYYTYGDIVDSKVYHNLKPYYYLDNLQVMFFFDSKSKGSINLPDKIYTELKSILSNQYQFLHQAAKCKLRYSQQLRNNSTEDALSNLNNASMIINRAFLLAQKSNNQNIQYTLTHMQVTKALILINFLHHYSKPSESEARKINQVIDCLYYFYVQFADYADELNSDENKDIKWFVNQLITPPCPFREYVCDEDQRNKVNEFVNAIFPYKVTISWKQN